MTEYEKIILEYKLLKYKNLSENTWQTKLNVL